MRNDTIDLRYTRAVSMRQHYESLTGMDCTADATLTEMVTDLLVAARKRGMILQGMVNLAINIADDVELSS